MVAAAADGTFLRQRTWFARRGNRGRPAGELILEIQNEPGLTVLDYRRTAAGSFLTFCQSGATTRNLNVTVGASISDDNEGT